MSLTASDFLLSLSSILARIEIETYDDGQSRESATRIRDSLTLPCWSNSSSASRA